jgi:hypothetical protein
MKLNTSTLEMTFAIDINQTCIDNTKYQYLSKWFVAIDKNRDNRALITGFANSVCLWDLNTMKITAFPNSFIGAYTMIPIFPIVSGSSGSSRQQSVMASVHYVNATQEGYFIIL